jgi:hypothetical protein
MKTVWIAGLAIAASTSVMAQSTIYKFVDDSGRITYSNKPMKGAVVMELEPLTTIPGTPEGRLQPASAPATAPTPAPIEGAPPAEKPQPLAAAARPAVAIVTPVSHAKPTLASIDPQVQRRRDDGRKRILEEELAQEAASLATARASLTQEQQNPQLVAAVRVAQQAVDPTPSQLLEFRNSIDKASGRIRGLQATIAEHEKNIEALNKELGALKP